MEKKSTSPTSTKNKSISISLNNILLWLVLIGLLIYVILSNTILKMNDGIPIGTIISFPSSSPPKGYLLCDGSDIPTKYSTLIKLLGGVQKTPDLRQMFIRGWSKDKKILDSVEESTSAKNLSIPDHTHDMLSWTSGGSGQPGGGDIFYASQSTYSTATGVRRVASPGDETKPAIENTALTISGDDETAPQHTFVPFYIKCY
jgi:microcystin-dependent protein